MALDKAALAAALKSAFRSTEPGVDSVDSLCDAMADAVDAFVKSGTVMTTTSGGNCVYSGTHPPLAATGQVV